jgi:hypothetical protein
MRDDNEAHDAADVLDLIGRALFGLAAAQTLTYVVLIFLDKTEISAVFDVALTLACRKFLLTRRSRTLAIVWTVSGLFFTALTVIDPQPTDNPVVDVVFGLASAVIGAVAIHATFRFHRALQTEVLWWHVFVVCGLVALYSVPSTLLMAYIVVVTEAGGIADTVVSLGILALVIAGFAGALPGTRNRPWAVVPKRSPTPTRSASGPPSGAPIPPLGRR